jgi:hypothetical protein
MTQMTSLLSHLRESASSADESKGNNYPQITQMGADDFFAFPSAGICVICG